MNLPPDKVRLLRSYDNEKKWELICDQVGALQKVSKVCMFLATTRPTAAISKMFHKTENDYEDEADSVNLISAQKCTDFHPKSPVCFAWCHHCHSENLKSN